MGRPPSPRAKGTRTGRRGPPRGRPPSRRAPRRAGAALPGRRCALRPRIASLMLARTPAAQAACTRGRGPRRAASPERISVRPFFRWAREHGLRLVGHVEGRALDELEAPRRPLKQRQPLGVVCQDARDAPAVVGDPGDALEPPEVPDGQVAGAVEGVVAAGKAALTQEVAVPQPRPQARPCGPALHGAVAEARHVASARLDPVAAMAVGGQAPSAPALEQGEVVLEHGGGGRAVADEVAGEKPAARRCRHRAPSDRLSARNASERRLASARRASTPS